MPHVYLVLKRLERALHHAHVHRRDAAASSVSNAGLKAWSVESVFPVELSNHCDVDKKQRAAVLEKQGLPVLREQIDCESDLTPGSRQRQHCYYSAIR